MKIRTIEEKYEIYFAISEQGKSTYDLQKEIQVDQSTISRHFLKLKKLFAESKEEYDKYLAWRESKKEPKYLLHIEERPDGTVLFHSPYSHIVDYCKRGYSRSKDKPKFVANLRERFNMASEVWNMLGRRDPSTWTEQDLNNILAQTSEGSQYNRSVIMRMVSPKLKQIDGLCAGLKPPPRRVPVLTLPQFPELFRKIIETAKSLARDERERDEIELILIVKSQTGMRTGKRRFEQGLWGTKIAEGKSHIEVVGDDFTWTVYEKWSEIWDINFKTDLLKSTVVNFIRKYQLKKGDWLISMSDERANDLLHQACEVNNISPLNLHDMRKIYVSFLVRAKIRLEQAVRLNVGWKTIGTAYDHYLHFQTLWEELEEQKRRFEELF